MKFRDLEDGTKAAIMDQLAAVRETGKVNMMDRVGVLNAAREMGCDELKGYLEDCSSLAQSSRGAEYSAMLGAFEQWLTKSEEASPTESSPGESDGQPTTSKPDGVAPNAGSESTTSPPSTSEPTGSPKSEASPTESEGNSPTVPASESDSPTETEPSESKNSSSGQEPGA